MHADGFGRLGLFRFLRFDYQPDIPIFLLSAVLWFDDFRRWAAKAVILAFILMRHRRILDLDLAILAYLERVVSKRAKISCKLQLKPKP